MDFKYCFRVLSLHDSVSNPSGILARVTLQLIIRYPRDSATKVAAKLLPVPGGPLSKINECLVRRALWGANHCLIWVTALVFPRIPLTVTGRYLLVHS